jgi:hypothetical protein
VQQTTGVPLVVMVKPDTFLIQEIKTLPAKAKVSGRYSHHFAGTWYVFLIYEIISSLSMEAFKRFFKPGMVVHTCNHSTVKVEV